MRFARIEALACRVFDLKPGHLKGHRRNVRIVLARQFVMYWTSRLRPDLSLPAIGRILGGRDHTTIMHGNRAYVVKRAKMGRTLKEAR